MSGRLSYLSIVMGAFVLLATAYASNAQGGLARYDVVSRDDGGLELRFHNMPLRAVHADDSQNALAVDFDSEVDSAAFDRLRGEFPDWIRLAYASFDSGVIRASRPVTFLTRPEDDGFSLRIIARQTASAPAMLRGSADGASAPTRTAGNF